MYTYMYLSIRPVLCGEALLKFAMGTCVRGSNAQIADSVSDRQYGAGRSGGAGQEVAEVRAAAAAESRLACRRDVLAYSQTCLLSLCPLRVLHD